MRGQSPPAAARHQRPDHDEHAGACEQPARRGIAEQHEDQRREHRRGIGSDAEQGDVALLHADIPDDEGEPDRAEAEAEYAAPFH